jgi:hypothetical protein
VGVHHLVVEPDVWCRITVIGPDGEELEEWTLSGPGRPDLAVVDLLARVRLLCGRDGRAVVVGELSAALVELLELAGLRGEVGGQVVGQPEEREDPLGVEEEVEGTDPPA